MCISEEFCRYFPQSVICVAAPDSSCLFSLWFVPNRSSHPFLMRLRSHTPKSSSDAGRMTDGNDACKPAHTHTHTHTRIYLRERECFFCWCQMSVHSQPYSLNISPQPKQCQDRNAGSTLHCRQENERKKNTEETFKVFFLRLIGHSKTFKQVIQSPCLPNKSFPFWFTRHTLTSRPVPKLLTPLSVLLAHLL